VHIPHCVAQLIALYISQQPTMKSIHFFAKDCS